MSDCYGFGRVLGEGAFAHVLHGRDRRDGRDVAIKVMLKSHIEREGKHRAVLTEQAALRKCAGCQHIIHLERTFQDDEYLFFVTEFASGGDLLRAMVKLATPEGGVGRKAAAYYSGEIWLGLRHLHSLGLAHRDLKPENVLLDHRGRVKIADFGAVLDTTGLESDEDERRSHRKKQMSERHGSFEGTAEYVSPEVLQGEETTTACDLWALGCVIFQLSTGRLPFQAATDFLLWEKILAFAQGEHHEICDRECDEATTAVTRALLKKEACDRLGAANPDDLEAHAFFGDHLDWEALRAGAAVPPYVPQAKDRVPDDRFTDFSLEFMLELDLREDDDDDDDDDESSPKRYELPGPTTPTTESTAARLRRSSKMAVEKIFGPSSPKNKPSSPENIRGRRGSKFSQALTALLGADASSSPYARAKSPSRSAVTNAEIALETWDWTTCLDDDVTILWKGIIWKRKGLIWRERVFVLTDKPRFAYFDASGAQPEYKGEIFWTYDKPVHARRRSQHHFDVITDDRDYHLASFDVGADVWIKRIDAALNFQATRRIEEHLDDDNPPQERGRRLSLSRQQRRSISEPNNTEIRTTIVLDEAPAVEGWLWKLGKPGAFGSSIYRRRYAILRGIQLHYYRDKPGSTQRAPTGVLRCKAARLVDDNNDTRFAFLIDVYGGRTLHCFVESHDDRQRWLDALTDVLAVRDHIGDDDTIPPPPDLPIPAELT